MTLDVFEPLREGLTLREAVNRLFEDSYVRPETNARAAKRTLPLDVLDMADELVIRASLPGCHREKVEINFQKDTLTIKGVLNGAPEAGDQGRWLLRERWTGEVSRTVVLPVLVDADKAKANFKDGILTLTLPKSEAVKPRSIPVTD